MTRARVASFCGVLVRRQIVSSRARSLVVRMMGGVGRPVRMAEGDNVKDKKQAIYLIYLPNTTLEPIS